MTDSSERQPNDTAGSPNLRPHEYRVSGTERINLRAIDPKLVALLASHFRAVEPGEWGPNNFDTWRATHDERSRNLEFTASDPRLPKMTVTAVDKRNSSIGGYDLGSEYRFKFEKGDGDTTYQIADLRINDDGTYEHLDFSSWYEVTPSGSLRMARPMEPDYRQAMEKTALWPYIVERLPEVEYTQPGIYGLKILDTILREYLAEDQS